jgi:exopolysaccharide production protein ExoZ
MRNEAASTAPASARIASMEGLRGYAVMLVFCVHFIDHYFRRRDGTDFNQWSLSDAKGVGDVIAHYFWASHYGVDVFFLLSGFLIFRMVARPEFRWGEFLKHRALRLYPAFAAALLIYVAYHAHFWGVTYDWKLLVQNAIFLPGIHELGVKAIIVPSWSLSFEWLFYLAAPPLLLLLRRWHGTLGPRQVIAVGAVLLALAVPIAPHYARLVMFFAGAWLAALEGPELSRWIGQLPDWVVVLLYLAVTLLFSFTQNYYIFAWPFAVVCTLLVARCLHGGGFLARMFSAAPVRWLGNVSYSFYLLHGLIIVAVVDHVGPLLGRFSTVVHMLTMIALALVASSVLAAISFRWLEQPYFKRRGRLGPRSERLAPATA